MASVPLGETRAPQAGPQLIGTVRQHGTASHPYAAGDDLLRGAESTRNLADAIHFLCALHGRYPGVIELVATRNVDPDARPWLGEAAEGFARERSYLATLSVRAGPMPATPGAGSEATLAMQRNAILTLAQSERRGCALGAALSLAADWMAIRVVLDAAAAKFGLDSPPPWSAGRTDTIAPLADLIGENPAMRRAMLFGAEQVAVQHRGLWDVLQARSGARA